ncbi:DNA primase, partial [Klebsiella pneumoniae]
VERNITPELAKYFDLRYCVEGKHAYVDPYTDQVKGQAFDMRILIPIYDLNGVMKTFQGRDITGAAERRYLFPMQLPASGRFLYNGHNAVGKQTVVVCEGAFDVMGVKRAIFDEETLRDYVEPIGTFGMHLSGNTTVDAEDQLGAFLSLKADGLRNVIMMWDSEKQAIRNTMAAARRLTSIGLNVKIACLGEEGLDPGEATQEQILKAYYRAKPYSKQLELQSKVLGIRVFNS